MDDLSKSIDIDSQNDLITFKTLVEDKRSDIEKRVQVAQKSIVKTSRRNLAIDVIVGTSASGLGAMIGGIPGAMIGAGIASVASKYGANISTRADEHDIEAIKELAIIRNKLTREVRKERYNRPFYYL